MLVENPTFVNWVYSAFALSKRSKASGLTVFIDDIDRYAAAAYEFGIHGIHYASSEALRADLVDLGIL